MLIRRDRIKKWVSVLIGLVLVGLFVYTVYFLFNQKNGVNECTAGKVKKASDVMQCISKEQ